MKTKKVVSINKKLDEKNSSDFISTSTSWPFELDPVHTYAYWDNAFTKDECKFIIGVGSFQKQQKSFVNAAAESSVYK